MNLNREQFLKAVERGQALLNELKKDYPELSLKPVFSRFGAHSGQCDLTTDLRKMVKKFPEMLRWNATAGRVFSSGGQASVLGDPAPPGNEQLDAKLLAPDLPLYCGDVLIEYRPENLNYESLRRLQQDSRLPPGLNEVGNIRVIAGSLEMLGTQNVEDKQGKLNMTTQSTTGELRAGKVSRAGKSVSYWTAWKARRTSVIFSVWPMRCLSKKSGFAGSRRCLEADSIRHRVEPTAGFSGNMSMASPNCWQD